MSRKLTVVFLVMVILVGAMSLKTIVTAHGNGPIMVAAGGPVPPTPWKAGGPVPPTPWKAGGPVPPTPWK
jgi:hypothetical protein